MEENHQVEEFWKGWINDEKRLDKLYQRVYTGLMTTGRPRAYQDQVSEMVRLYVDQQMSASAIARQLGLSVQTVLRNLRREDVDLVQRTGGKRRPLSEEHKQAISESRKGKGTGPRVTHEIIECAECGAKFEYRPSYTGKKFCSRQCRLNALGKARKGEGQQNYQSDPRRCPCGNPIPYEYRHARSYCSPECRKKYANQKPSDPSNKITFQCETCGKEVTRYKKYGNGASRFCSNECSAKSPNVRVVVEGDVVLDSGWESLFWGLCKLHKVSVQRIDRAEVVEWKPTRWYAPDFLINKVAVEVKGVIDVDDRQKWEAWRQQRGPLAVLSKEGLHEMVKVENQGSFYRFLDKVAEDHPYEQESSYDYVRPR